MRIIVINGHPMSGKSTFVKFCREAAKGKFIVDEYSTIEYVLTIAKICGYNSEKDEKGRKFLSKLKEALIEYNDKPFHITCAKIRQFIDYLGDFDSSDFENKNTLFIHCREPEEIDKLKTAYPEIKTLLIERDETDNKLYHNESDNNVFDYYYDYVISNNGSFEDLKEKAKKFILS